MFGKYILTSEGVYSRGFQLDSTKTIGDNINFVNGTSIQLLLKPQFSKESDEKGKKLLEEFKELIVKRGGRTYKGLTTIFKSFDSQIDDRELTVDELKDGCTKFGMPISSSDASAIMRAIDYDNTGSINLSEFLRAIRGRLNAPRLEVVKRAFEKFDKTGDGVITLEDLRQLGYKFTKDQYFKDFFNQFQDNQGGLLDDVITFDEFEEYYARVSSNIDNDLHFIELIEKAWGLNRTV